MGRHDAERRGTIAVVVVSLSIVVLFVALSGGGRGDRVQVEEATASTLATTTTVGPTTQLCQLARRFADDAEGVPTKTVAQLAEVFYDRARLLIADPGTRAEYEAAWNFYRTYNDLGEPAGYDLFTIAAQGNGERWRVLVTKPGLGVDSSVANVAFVCKIDLPTIPVLDLPPPNFATTTTTTEPPDPTATSPGAGTPTTRATGTRP